jgi:hypothetical protein
MSIEEKQQILAKYLNCDSEQLQYWKNQLSSLSEFTLFTLKDKKHPDNNLIVYYVATEIELLTVFWKYLENEFLIKLPLSILTIYTNLPEWTLEIILPYDNSIDMIRKMIIKNHDYNSILAKILEDFKIEIEKAFYEKNYLKLLGSFQSYYIIKQRNYWEEELENDKE